MGRGAAAFAVRLGIVACVAGLVVIGGAVGATGAGATPARSAGPHVPVPTVYQLSLGDSLAAGTGASVAADRYVNLVAAHEQANYPGLVLENLACGGATTTTMIHGPGCSYTSGTQLGDAEAFLSAHRGSVAYVTIDIGANDVDGCLLGTSINLACITTGFAAIRSNLAQIVTALRAADPGVAVFGMDYYDPFLELWVLGTSTGEQLARESAPLSADLNSLLTTTYGAYGAVPVDVQGPFAVQDFAMTGRFKGTVVPENVSRTCAWTHMCDPSGTGYAMNIHANDIGHGVIADAFDSVIDRWHSGGGGGQWVAASDGSVTPLGNAVGYGSMAGQCACQPAVGLVPTADRKGYWMVARDGGVFTYGDAGFYGSTGNEHLVRPIVGMAATPDGRGYWLVAADGGVFAFGDAGFAGSLGADPSASPVVAMAATGSGKGYWLVAADGQVFAFGDAGAYGPASGLRLSSPVVGMAPTVDSNGYWLVAADGGIFAYGDAQFRGSAGNERLNRPVVGMAVAPNGFGYWLAGADGGVFTFGGAPFNGSAAGRLGGADAVAIATN